jgi:hypothetical protein
MEKKERDGLDWMVTCPLPTGSENLGEGRLHKTGPACLVLRYRAEPVWLLGNQQ